MIEYANVQWANPYKIIYAPPWNAYGKSSMGGGMDFKWSSPIELHPIMS